MPELPEVETTRRGIAPSVTGVVVTDVRVRNPRLRLPVPAALHERVVGGAVLAVRRRAKYLLFDFSAGGLIVHLGMSGSLRVVPSGQAPAAHDHIDLVFGEFALRYRDPRRFGLFAWSDAGCDAHPLLAGLGPEPLGEEFDGACLHRHTRATRVAIKQALMDGKRVVGVGNIYASESLFRARINPLLPASRLGPRRCARLADCIRATLSAAIEAGGSTLRDFVGGDGQPGYFQQSYHVYGRDGEPCLVCGSTVRRTVLGQRATYWCPVCQAR